MITKRPTKKLTNTPTKNGIENAKSFIFRSVAPNTIGAESIKENLAASFQNRVTEILTKKTIKALKDYKVNNLIVAGGVAANKGLRMRLKEECDKENINLTIPEIKYCTDNGAMIAAAGYHEYKAGRRADLYLNAIPNLKIGER